MSNGKFNLIIVSAGMEQGGNCLHRHLDGHPNLFVYPFESMLGTPKSSNIATSYVPFRYAWPSFDSEMTAEQAYHAMYDEELKTFLRTPDRSKFKNCGLKMDEKERIKFFEEISSGLRTDNMRANYIESYFRSTFCSWENFKEPDLNEGDVHYVGYSPMILLDADKIFHDFPDAKIVHIVRNPWSGYADTIKRPFPWSLEKYCQIWNLAQLTYLNCLSKYPKNFTSIFYESLFSNLKSKIVSFKQLCIFLNINYNKSLLYPSFNGEKLDQVFPWGTIKNPNIKSNKETANELSEDQKNKIWIECRPILDSLGYEGEF